MITYCTIIRENRKIEIVFFEEIRIRFVCETDIPFRPSRKQVRETENKYSKVMTITILSYLWLFVSENERPPPYRPPHPKPAASKAGGGHEFPQK